MRTFGSILFIACLAACDPSYEPPSEPSTSTGGTAITLSGSARVGVSTTR